MTQRQTIRVVCDLPEKRVYLEPEGIELTCIRSVDVHVDSESHSLVMEIPENRFEVDIRQKKEG